MGICGISSDSSSSFMDVSHWESTGWPVFTAMTSGAVGSTGSSDIVGQVNSPLLLAMPMQPLVVAPSQFP